MTKCPNSHNGVHEWFPVTTPADADGPEETVHVCELCRATRECLEPGPGEIMRPGEVWESPKGTLYKVVQPGAGTQVVLAQGATGKGRRQFRRRDRIKGWTLLSEDRLASHFAEFYLEP